MKNTKIINRLIDFYLEGSELTQGEHNTVRSLKEEMQAINYTRCSTQLKDKYGEDFAYFVEKKVNARKIEDVYYYDDKLFLCADDLFKEYQKLTKPLIV
jgi:hypothetical protein